MQVVEANVLQPSINFVFMVSSSAFIAFLQGKNSLQPCH
jgi:hypothetical protein